MIPIPFAIVKDYCQNWKKADESLAEKQKNDNITQIPPSRVLEFCAKGDDICEKQNYVVRPVHLTYGADASAAAAFVKQVIGLRR